MNAVVERRPELADKNIKLRLRECKAEKLYQVYHDARVLESYSMHDDKDLSVQILMPGDYGYDQEGTVELESDVLILVKVWHPDTWELEPPRELWIRRSSTLEEVAVVLSTLLGIAPENLVAAKINSPWNFHRVQLPFVDWVKLSGAAKGKDDLSQNPITNAPFYLSTDGILFVVRDSSKVEREMSGDERELYRCEAFEELIAAGGALKDGKGVGRKRAGGEAGVRITVVKGHNAEE
jgi:hypothetical protein